MPSNWIYIFVCLFSGDSDITVIPQNFTVEFDNSGFPSTNLTVVCKPPAESTIQGITFMQLRKRRSNDQHDTPVATCTPTTNGGFPVKEVGLANRKYNLSGSVSAEYPTESFLRVEFHDASCVDEGEYECRVHFYREGATGNEVNSHSASITTKSKYVYMI